MTEISLVELHEMEKIMEKKGIGINIEDVKYKAFFNYLRFPVSRTPRDPSEWTSPIYEKFREWKKENEKVVVLKRSLKSDMITTGEGNICLKQVVSIYYCEGVDLT